jgi:hypothetical protein
MGIIALVMFVACVCLLIYAWNDESILNWLNRRRERLRNRDVEAGVVVDGGQVQSRENN